MKTCENIDVVRGVDYALSVIAKLEVSYGQFQDILKIL